MAIAELHHYRKLRTAGFTMWPLKVPMESQIRQEKGRV